MSVSYKMRILVGAMNLTSPLYGGGDKALIDWLLDLHTMGHEISIININPQIIKYENQLPFDFIHLLENTVWKTEDLKNETVKKHALKLINQREEYDYYLGYGWWGAGWKQVEKTFASIIKNQYPKIRTINLIWDLHTLNELDSDCEILMHGAPYHLIKHPQAPLLETKRTFLLPKQNSYQTIDNYDITEWLSRPYDFIFNNPSIYKGSPIVINLALNFPHKKFLVKKGTWAFWDIYGWYEKWLDIMGQISNIDIIDTVEDMENDFFRKGRYLLYPSVSEGFGLMPMEAATQGTIPICADTEILRYSSSPFAEFIYSDAYTFNPISITNGWGGGIDNIDWFEATKDWVNRIRFLDNNFKYVEILYNNLQYVENHVELRYKKQLDHFLRDLEKF